VLRLVIGRLTYESMDVVPPDSFIVTSQAGLVLKPGCKAVAILLNKRCWLQQATGKDVFVIGGASLYAAVWPYCQRFFLDSD
jgi:dihydrofolate reductase